jgi:hypothetical protein
MTTPEHIPSASSSPSLNHNLGSTARELLRLVEVQTGQPVVIRQVPVSIHRTYGYVTYATHEQPHVISLIPEMEPFWDYLIAHECGHVFRFFKVAEEERLMAAIETPHRRRAVKTLSSAVRLTWQNAFGLSRIKKPIEVALINTYLEGLVGQVVNFPSDLRIESWMYHSLPDLRTIQEATLRVNIAELNLGLDPTTRRIVPGAIFDVATSLNAGYCEYVARLLDDPLLSKPHHQAGFGSVGDELAGEIWQTRGHGYSQDRRDTNRWAKRFRMREWFTWRHYPS